MHSPKRVGLVLHPRRDSREAVQAVLDWTGRHDATVVGLPGEVDRIGCDIEEVEPDALAGVDLLISLGGDGTMLRALRLSQPTGVPVLGVNLGRLGFLAEIDVPDLANALAEIDAGNSRWRRGSRCRSTSTTPTAFAFNDVAVVRHPGQPVAAVEVDGRGPALRAVRGGRHRGRHPDRVHRVQLLGRRPDRVAPGRRAAGDPGRAALGVQPGDIPVRGGAGRAASCWRPAAGSRSRWTACWPAPSSPARTVQVFLCARAGRVVRLGTTTFYQRARRKLRLADPAELDEVDVTKTA